MPMIVCPSCGLENIHERRFCKRCKTALRSGEQCVICNQCQSQLATDTNYCPKCAAPGRPNRLSGRDTYPKVADPHAVTCYTPKERLCILASPDANSERLYVIGVGDILQITGEDDGFYAVSIPGQETGYVMKAQGSIISVALGDVLAALGYVRIPSSNQHVVITYPQPDNVSKTIYEMTIEDRLPIVEEREHTFLVQLPNRLRGWVQKSQVIRTISDTSLPPDDSIKLGSVLLRAGAILVGAIGGAAIEAYKQNMNMEK